MLHGRIVAESLRAGAALQLDGLSLTRVERVDMAGAVAPGQPSVWTLIDISAPSSRAGQLAAALSTALAAEGGWYADFRSGAEHTVVFAGRSFCYRVGDAAGRAEAMAYGRNAGVPESQLDWGD